MLDSLQPPEQRASALTRAQADEVLRYWLAALRLEEALQIRPQARRSTGGSVVPRLDQPVPGQDYFKLPLDASFSQLLAQQVQLTRPFDSELCAFFESWLERRYRRSDEDTELSHLLCFPVVHLRTGELAGLVRWGVRLRFGAASSKDFRSPSWEERQRAAYPPPPDQARLTRAVRADTAWPFLIDTRLMRQPLGVPAESIDALFEALRASDAVSEQHQLALLTVTLEDVANRSASEPESVAARAERLTRVAAAQRAELAAWLERLTAAVRRLLEQGASRARVYPVGIVVDGTQAKSTWHLQRDLNGLLEAEGSARFRLESALGAYLTGRALQAQDAPQRALFPGPALSASQRAAAERFWGSSLSAVQGPPGTGKTRLILHLCAEALVRQVEALQEGASQSPELFLVTSSNNRAVDNVLEPLTAGDGLPLALRAGSRQVCEQQLAGGLRRTLAWLKRAEQEPERERERRLALAQAHLQSCRAALEQRLAPRRAGMERAAKRAALERALEQLLAKSAEAAPAEPLEVTGLNAPPMRALLDALAALEERLQALSQLCEAQPGQAQLQALERHFRRTAARYAAPFHEALKQAGLSFELTLPPPALPADVEQQMECWEEATERCLSGLAELRASLASVATRARRSKQERRLRAELAALAPEAAPPVTLDHDRLSHELFQAAVAAREAWASERATELAQAVAIALRTVEQERSLRSLFRSEPTAARSLCRLFGIWGSTLLSLGNCWPSDQDSVARLVIDEAGQCHPAHAVSALLRAKCALMIGDVHQLTPVFELGSDDEARLLRSCRLDTPLPRLLPYRVRADAQVSVQSLADRAVGKRLALLDHFRCQPEIIAISDALCDYGLTVHTSRADRPRHAEYLTQAVSLVDLRGEQTAQGGSWCNPLELRETVTLVESLLERGVPAAEIAVITPYRAQLERLFRAFSERRLPFESSAELAESDGGAAGQRAAVALGTVHRFQGGERSVVLFSSVVTHPLSLGFLNARPNLLNVAVSRARHHFVCLGHASLLAQGARTRLLTRAAHALSPASYGGFDAPALPTASAIRATWHAARSDR